LQSFELGLSSISAARHRIVSRARLFYTKVEESGLGCGVLAQLGHLVYLIHTAVRRLFLLPLGSALHFLALFLLTCLFLLTLRKR